MSSTDYFTPFVEVSRAMCDGVDNCSVMHLIPRRITKTLRLIENARIYQRVKYEYQQLLIEFGYDGSSQRLARVRSWVLSKSRKSRDPYHRFRAPSEHGSRDWSRDDGK